MTVIQIIFAICIFAVSLWLINRYVPAGLFHNILIGVVIVLALLCLLQGFGLMNLLNTPVTSGNSGWRRGP